MSGGEIATVKPSAPPPPNRADTDDPDDIRHDELEQEDDEVDEEADSRLRADAARKAGK